MPVEIRHLDHISHGRPWMSYHYSGEKTALGHWNGSKGSQYYVKDAEIEVIGRDLAVVRFNLRTGFIMNPEIKRANSLRSPIDIRRNTKEKMVVSMNSGDELTFNAPNYLARIRVYKPRN